MIIFSTICLTICVLCAILSLALSIYAVIEIKSFQKSTHQVSFEPVDLEKLKNLGASEVKDWGSTEKELEKELNELPPNEINRELQDGKSFRSRFE